MMLRCVAMTGGLPVSASYVASRATHTTLKNFKKPLENMNITELSEVLHEYGIPLTGAEFQTRFDSAEDFAAKHYSKAIFGQNTYATLEEHKAFLETLQDPSLAYIVNSSAKEYRNKKNAEHFSFKNRFRNACHPSGVPVDYSVSADVLKQLSKLDNVELVVEKTKSTQISAKIKRNLYDTANIVEDDTEKPFIQASDAKQDNVVHQLATNDPAVLETVGQAQRQFKKLVQHPSDISNTDTVRFLERQWYPNMFSPENNAHHFGDDVELDIEPVLKKNFEKPAFRNKFPKAEYSSYIEAVNDFFNKYENSYGLMRVAPEWLDIISQHQTSESSVPPTDGYLFPQGIVIVQVSKFLRVHDRYITTKEVQKEIQTLKMKEFLLEDMQKPYENERDAETMQYLKDADDTHYLILNLRYNSYAIARYSEMTPFDMAREEAEVMDRDAQEFIYSIDVDRSFLYPLPEYRVFHLPPEWATVFKSVPFPSQSGTSRFSPLGKVWKFMNGFLPTLQIDNSPLRTDIDLKTQSIRYDLEKEHPLLMQIKRDKMFVDTPEDDAVDPEALKDAVDYLHSVNDKKTPKESFDDTMARRVERRQIREASNEEDQEDQEDLKEE